ncbi:MAG: type VI secretion system-associated protein TagF [Methylococcaceae bacterium]|jgi:type VI secretion system protein ImpM
MPAQAHIGYFGKIPSRGDFIKAAENTALMALLDQWLTQAMGLLAENPRWKFLYDDSKAINFAFVGPRKSHAVIGHIIASSDLAGRRFPFLTASSMAVAEPVKLVSYSPMAFAKFWDYLSFQSNHIVTVNEAMEPLQNLSSVRVPLEFQGLQFEQVFADFLQLETLGALNEKLLVAGFKGSVRQLVLALGLLLQPIMTSHKGTQPEKSIVLPLPNDAIYGNLVGTFWMHLITPFLLRDDFELALFTVTLAKYRCLVLGFNGASSRTLQAIYDSQIGDDLQLDFDDTPWVEEQVNSDYNLKKLSSYLMHPSLSLSAVLSSFHENFIGI